jgi:hypothetical protein
MNEANPRYPFSKEATEYRDIEASRRKAKELGRWYFAEKSEPSYQSSEEIRIIMEPDALTYVDGEVGIIKINISKYNDDEIFCFGGFYNPKKGSDTLYSLFDILKYIAKYTMRKVSCKTTRVNRTQHLVDLLLSKGFEADGEEFIISFDKDSKPNFEYPELNNSLNSKFKISS